MVSSLNSDELAMVRPKDLLWDQCSSTCFFNDLNMGENSVVTNFGW